MRSVVRGPHLDERAAPALPVRPGSLRADRLSGGAWLRRRERAYRGDLPPVALTGQTVILVDDGSATWFLHARRGESRERPRARRIVVAVPVGPEETVRDLARLADERVCVATPRPFLAVNVSTGFRPDLG